MSPSFRTFQRVAYTETRPGVRAACPYHIYITRFGNTRGEIFAFAYAVRQGVHIRGQSVCRSERQVKVQPTRLHVLGTSFRMIMSLLFPHCLMTTTLNCGMNLTRWLIPLSSRLDQLRSFSPLLFLVVLKSASLATPIIIEDI